MPEPGLWVRFLEDDGAGPAPRLRLHHEPDAPEIVLTDRARWVLAAVALPRELVAETASDERQRARLGSRVWSSGEITARIPYQHRSTIRHALSDLRHRLREHDIVLEDHLLVDTERGRYGVRPGRMTVDIVELHALREDPDAVDRYLETTLGSRGRARLAPVCAGLLDPVALAELEATLDAAAARATRPRTVDAGAAGEDAAVPADAPAAEPAVAVPSAPGGTSGPSAPGGTSGPSAPGETSGPSVPGETSGPSAPAEAGAPTGAGRRGRRLSFVALGLALLAAAAVAVILALGAGNRSLASIRADGPPRVEVAGGVAHTWSDPRSAGGRPGPEILDRQHVTIACRLRGFIVPDGNAWWYLIASRPWSRRFFVTADAFYNNGHTHGSLRGSAFVDPKVALCSGGPSAAR